MSYFFLVQALPARKRCLLLIVRIIAAIVILGVMFVAIVVPVVMFAAIVVPVMLRSCAYCNSP